LPLDLIPANGASIGALLDFVSRNSYSIGMNAILSEKGQVTIPKAIRDSLGLEAGSVLEFTEEEGHILVRKVVQENPISIWRGRGALPIGRSVNEYLKLTRGG